MKNRKKKEQEEGKNSFSVSKITELFCFCYKGKEGKQKNLILIY